MGRSVRGSPTKGRTVFLALTLVLLWIFIVDQVQSDEPGVTFDVGSAEVGSTEVGSAKTVPVVNAGFDDDGPQNYGDDPALDDLYDDCESGDLVACDDLYFQAPLGSEYEEFGSTCGGIGGPSSSGSCASGDTSDNNFDNNFDDSPPPDDFNNDFDSGGGVDDSPIPNVEDEIGQLTGSGSDPDRGPGVVSMVIGLVYLGAAFGLDRKKLDGAATPFLVIGMFALAFGSIGAVYDTPWVLGLLLVATGILGAWIAVATALRRGSAWLALLIVVVGVLVFVADLFESALSDGSVVGFGLVTAAIGVVIIAGAGLVVAQGILRDPQTEEELEEFTRTGEFTRPEPPAPPAPPAPPPPPAPPAPTV